MIGIDSNFLVACEIQEHDHHASSRVLLSSFVQAGEKLAVAPQVLAELLHIVTDSRRLQKPRTMAEALEATQLLRTASEVQMISPTPDADDLFFRWMSDFRLGRKRILHTLLAATYSNAGINRIATIHVREFQVFGVFQIIAPSNSP
jgi:predicted nucleic acid-binding protein